MWYSEINRRVGFELETNCIKYNREKYFCFILWTIIHKKLVLLWWISISIIDVFTVNCRECILTYRKKYLPEHNDFGVTGKTCLHITSIIWWVIVHSFEMLFKSLEVIKHLKLWLHNDLIPVNCNPPVKNIDFLIVF